MIRHAPVLTLLLLYLLPALICAVPISRGQYKFPASVDPQVLDSDETELWAEVYRPTNLGEGPYPLIIFLHGNHGTCGRVLQSGIRTDSSTQYTFSGTCPNNFVVVPNHEGYRYVAAPLARKGAVVVSINANRGINGNGGGFDDFGLNLARGRLVLQHIAKLASWARGDEPTPSALGSSLEGQIDFGQVGLMGHSRGGEGVRAALELFTESSSPWPTRIGEALQIRAIFEVAPVDGQTSRVLNVQGVASNILLPTCDGDVSSLEGMAVFDRAFLQNDRIARPKSTLTVIGANHNGFNTEWQESDSLGCSGATPLFSRTGPSAEQQLVLRITLIAFMQAHVLGNAGRARIFDPAFPLSARLRATTFFERGHLRAPPSPRTGIEVIQSFTGPSLTSDNGFDNEVSRVSVRHARSALFEHDSSQRTAEINWSGGGLRFYSINFNGDAGLDFSDVKTISFRIALGCDGQVCNGNIDDSPDVGVQVSLSNDNDQFSPEVDVSDFVSLRRPTGQRNAAPHDILRTVEIPLTAFRGVSLNTVRQMRFRFSSPQTARVFLAQITTDTETSRTISVARLAAREASHLFNRVAENVTFSRMALPLGSVVAPALNKVLSATRTNDIVELGLTSETNFPVTDSLPRLTVGSVETNMGVVMADTYKVQFFFRWNDYVEIQEGDRLMVQIGDTMWNFGSMPDPLSIL